MDAARTAIRMGAGEVTVAYRKTINEMRALRSEYEEAVEEGVRFMWNTEVKEAIGEPGSDRLSRLIIVENGVEREVEADHLIGAVGSGPAARIVSTTTGIEVDERGYVKTMDEPYGMTTRAGVFAGGDVSDQPATVVHAMRDAQLVAEGIGQYVAAVKLMGKINSRKG